MLTYRPAPGDKDRHVSTDATQRLQKAIIDCHGPNGAGAASRAASRPGVEILPSGSINVV